MNIKLHANATTTPKICQYIQQSDHSVAELAGERGISETTARRWKCRETTVDRSHIPHRLPTPLTATQEWLIVELRKTLLLPLDDLRCIAREFIFPALSRSALGRCLRRHGVANLKTLLPQIEPPTSLKELKAYESCFVHIDIKYLPLMRDESKRRHLFMGIDSATRWVYLEVRKDKSSHSAASFPKHLLNKPPVHDRIVLTDNGREFTDRFTAQGKREPTGEHAFDEVCTKKTIEHRLIKPVRPQTNGMVERFNGRISTLLKEHRFGCRQEPADTLVRDEQAYNQHIPQ